MLLVPLKQHFKTVKTTDFKAEVAVHFSHFALETMSETETDYEQSDDRESTPEVEVQRRPHRGGKGGHHVREEPTSLTYLQACPLAVTCFRH